MIAFPPPAPADVTVISVQVAKVARVSGAGRATVLAAGGRVAVLRPPGVDVPGPIRVRAARVRWLARDIAGAPAGRPVPDRPARFCARFARGARRIGGPPLGADPGTLMREVCRLTFRLGGFRGFTEQTGIPVRTPVPAPQPTASPTPAPTTLPNRTGTQLFEWSVHVARDPIAAGDDELVVTNSGEDDHELAVRDADGVLLGQTGVLRPRSDAVSLHLALAPGVYTLFCPLTGHEDLGMAASLTVR